MRLKIDETWQVVGFPFEQNFLLQSPECFEKSCQLVLGNLTIRIVFIDESKNQPCKMKLLIKRPKNSTKQWQKKYLFGRKQKVAHLRALKDGSKGNEKNPLACRVHELQTVKILILGISIIIGAGKHDNYSIFLMTICKRG